MHLLGARLLRYQLDTSPSTLFSALAGPLGFAACGYVYAGTAWCNLGTEMQNAISTRTAAPSPHPPVARNTYLEPPCPVNRHPVTGRPRLHVFTSGQVNARDNLHGDLPHPFPHVHIICAPRGCCTPNRQDSATYTTRSPATPRTAPLARACPHAALACASSTMAARARTCSCLAAHRLVC